MRPEEGKVKRTRILPLLVAATMLRLAPPAWSQDVGPALLQAAAAAYQQEQQKQAEIPPASQAREGPPKTPPTQAEWKNLSHLEIGARIAVKTKDGATHTGEFVALSDEAISLREGKREVGYGREEVIRVSRLGSPGRTRWKGKLIGGAIGFVIGAPLVAQKFTESGEKKNGVIIGGIAGAGVGILVGHLVDRSSPTLIYRTP